MWVLWLLYSWHSGTPICCLLKSVRRDVCFCPVRCLICWCFFGSHLQESKVLGEVLFPEPCFQGSQTSCWIFPKQPAVDQIINDDSFTGHMALSLMSRGSQASFSGISKSLECNLPREALVCQNKQYSSSSSGSVYIGRLSGSCRHCAALGCQRLSRHSGIQLEIPWLPPVTALGNMLWSDGFK